MWMWSVGPLGCLVISGVGLWCSLRWMCLVVELYCLSSVWIVWTVGRLGHYANLRQVWWVVLVCVIVLALWWRGQRGLSLCISICCHSGLVSCSVLLCFVSVWNVLVESLVMVMKLFPCRKSCILDSYCCVGSMTMEFSFIFSCYHGVVFP
jgi:hypothetical protein